MKQLKLAVLISSLLALQACNVSVDVSDEDDHDDDYPTEPTPTPMPDIEVADIFPTDLTVSSPFASEIADDDSQVSAAAEMMVPHYTWATQRISRVLNGTTPLRDDFMPMSFFRNGMNAECFGPSIDYVGHPDATDPSDPTQADGNLPGGDLGLWAETDAMTGDACSVAQVNALLSGIQSQSRMSLMTLAALVSAAQDNGLAVPEAGMSVPLTNAMNDEEIDDVEFSLAYITQNSDYSYEYHVNFTYTYDSDEYDIALTLEHQPSGSYDQYSGVLNMTAEGLENAGMISLPGANCPDDERTKAVSLVYQRDGSDMNLQARSATLCGHDVADAFDEDGQVAADNGYDSTDNSDGWSENFNILGTEYDIDSLAGDYSFVWQAGIYDSNSRVFMMGLNDHDPMDGEAHFGYGDVIADTTGDITGFICNWAGPGSSHALMDKTQRQFIEYDDDTGLFDGTDFRANIAYAPTNSCNYDGAGVFLFDIDASGTLGDTSEEDITVPLTNDLWMPMDGDDLATGLANRGISAPSVPLNWPGDE